MLRRLNHCLWPPLAALVVVLGLFWLMWQLIAMHDQNPQLPANHERVSLQLVQPEPDPVEQPDNSEAAPSAEQAIAQAQNVPQAVPSIPNTAVPQASISLPAFTAGAANLSMDLTLGSSGLSGAAFAVEGGGAGGRGAGRGFTGKKLVPVSTGRPQFPQYAYERGLSGWVEVVFVVDANGQVKNPRILDAQPKGIFEEAAVLSVLSWQYDRQVMAGQAREVRQRLEFKPEDFHGNWR